MDNKAVVPIMVQCAGLQITALPFYNGVRCSFGMIGLRLYGSWPAIMKIGLQF
jgi:hypothetical protein